MRLRIFMISLLLAATWETSWAGEPTIADGPDAICPLIAGAFVPDVTVVTPDRRPVELSEILEAQPTILIYYRGGW